VIPIKDTIPRETFPFMTFWIIVINVGIFLIELTLPKDIQNAIGYLFGLVPARYAHPVWARVMGFPLDSYWPFLTNIFLHGGWLHIIGNMWFLFLFGYSVEGRMGHVRFLLFYLLAGIASNLVFFIMNSNSTVPVIGASGAIAGVMGAYLRIFPLAKIVTLVPIWIVPLFFKIPAVFFMAFWFAMQVFFGTLSLTVGESGEGIAWWAHIGGFAVGFLFAKHLVTKSPKGPAPRK